MPHAAPSRHGVCHEILNLTPSDDHSLTPSLAPQFLRQPRSGPGPDRAVGESVRAGNTHGVHAMRHSWQGGPYGMHAPYPPPMYAGTRGMAARMGCMPGTQSLPTCQGGGGCGPTRLPYHEDNDGKGNDGSAPGGSRCSLHHALPYTSHALCPWWQLVFVLNVCLPTMAA